VKKGKKIDTVLFYRPPAKIFSSDQIKKNEISGACSTYGNRSRPYKIMVEKSDGKRSLIKSRSR
jgi:hypothetical protein